jgi:hypothetical protein
MRLDARLSMVVDLIRYVLLYWVDSAKPLLTSYHLYNHFQQIR